MDDTCETPSRMLGNRLRRLQLKVNRDIAYFRLWSPELGRHGRTGQGSVRSVYPTLKNVFILAEDQRRAKTFTQPGFHIDAFSSTSHCRKFPRVNLTATRKPI